MQDIERLARFLRPKVYENFYFQLTGFSDSSGDLTHNYNLSKMRAEQVAAQLKAKGIVMKHDAETQKKYAPLGFSSFAPVTCEDNSESRARNRRVEVWVYDPVAN